MGQGAAPHPPTENTIPLRGKVHAPTPGGGLVQHHLFVMLRTTNKCLLVIRQASMSVELSASGRFEASSNPRLRGLSSEAVFGIHSARLRQSQATQRPKFSGWPASGALLLQQGIQLSVILARSERGGLVASVSTIHRAPVASLRKNTVASFGGSPPELASNTALARRPAVITMQWSSLRPSASAGRAYRAPLTASVRRRRTAQAPLE